MELKLKTIYPTIKTPMKPHEWTHIKYFFAIAWWRSSAYGLGHFNSDLYERYLIQKTDVNLTGNYNF